MQVDTFEIHESNPEGSDRPSKFHKEQCVSLEEAMQYCIDQVTLLEMAENVERDRFRYEIASYVHGTYISAPTHQLFLHMPVFTILRTTEEK